MLSLDDLIKFGAVKKIPIQKRRAVVREYLQTLVLFHLQQTKPASKMIFIGGTALRFIHDLQRFSEDLDFNYLGTLQKRDIEKLLVLLKRELKKENVSMDFSIRKSKETYFHWKVYLQFPEVLQFYKCGGKRGNALNADEKLSIQLDIQNLSRKTYPIEKKIIDNFGKRFIINTTNLDMFLAEKSNAMFYRKPPRGRDFFDFMSLVFLDANANLAYLKKRDIGVKNKKEYLDKIRKRVNHLDFGKLTEQLSPFLFDETDKEIMENFPDHLEEILRKLEPIPHGAR